MNSLTAQQLLKTSEPLTFFKKKKAADWWNLKYYHTTQTSESQIKFHPRASPFSIGIKERLSSSLMLLRFNKPFVQFLKDRQHILLASLISYIIPYHRVPLQYKVVSYSMSFLTLPEKTIHLKFIFFKSWLARDDHFLFAWFRSKAPFPATLDTSNRKKWKKNWAAFIKDSSEPVLWRDCFFYTLQTHYYTRYWYVVVWSLNSKMNLCIHSLGSIKIST